MDKKYFGVLAVGLLAGASIGMVITHLVERKKLREAYKLDDMGEPFEDDIIFGVEGEFQPRSNENWVGESAFHSACEGSFDFNSDEDDFGGNNEDFAEEECGEAWKDLPNNSSSSEEEK